MHSTLVTMTLVLLVVLGSAFGWAADQTGPVLKADVEFTDCRACHGQAVCLPRGHVSPAEADCRTCHHGQTRLRTKLSLDHLHQMAGVECTDCHQQTDRPAPLTQEQCLACHGPYRKLVAATQSLPRNIHDSHYRDALECDACHHVHSKSENYCATCHDWSLPVP